MSHYDTLSYVYDTLSQYKQNYTYKLITSPA